MGREAGIPLDVGVGDAAVLGSMMMLLPMTILVALLVAVAVRDITGEGLLVTDETVGIGIVAESLLLEVTDDVGATLFVTFSELDGVRVALLGGRDELIE